MEVRSRVSSRTISPALAIAAAVERAGCRPTRSRTSTSAAPTRPARTTATSPAWRRCSRGCPSRSPASPSTGCARPGSRRSSRPPRGCGRRRRPVRRRRRRVDEPRAAGDGQAGHAFPRGNQTPTTRRSAGASRTRRWRRCSRSSRWARPARTSPSAGTSRARIRTRSRWSRSGAGRRASEAGRFDEELVAVGDVVRDEHRGRTRRRAAGKLKPAFAKAARSPPATRAASTTAPPRSWSRRGAREEARGRAAGRVRRRAPSRASIRA